MESLSLLVFLFGIALLMYLFLSREKNGEQLQAITYTNSPSQNSYNVTDVQPTWGGNYYQYLTWFPAYRENSSVYNRPGFPYNVYQDPEAYDNAYMFAPLGAQFATSLKWDDDQYPPGTVMFEGIAYSKDPNDKTVVNVYKQNMDFDRDVYKYLVQTKDGMNIPLDRSVTYLENNDEFDIPGYEGIGPFILKESPDNVIVPMR